MVSVPPQCRQKLQQENLGPYPRSACLQCGWKIGKAGSLEEMCNEPGYALVEEEISPSMNYVAELNKWVENIVKHTGLQMHTPYHVPLILMYTLMAMHKGKETTQEDVHDAWALWTLYIRDMPDHENMLPYDQLTERVKALDKIDMWAINMTAEECK